MFFIFFRSQESLALALRERDRALERIALLLDEIQQLKRLIDVENDDYAKIVRKN